MKILILYIVAFFVILFVFFIDKKEQTQYVLLPAGLLYSSEVSSKTILSQQVSEITETTLYRSVRNNDLPTLYVFSKLRLPPKFIGRTTNKENASYTIYHATQQISFASRLKKHPPRRTKRKKKSIKLLAKKQSINPNTVKKKKTEIVFNFHILNNIIKKSDRTYFFSQKEKRLGSVTVRIYSTTPWQNKDILRYKIINLQEQYFFVTNISLYEQKQYILAEFYNEPLVAPEKTVDCIVLMPRQKQKRLTLKLAESGGKERMFSVTFDTP